MISLYPGLLLTKLYAAHGFGFKTGSGVIADRTLCNERSLVSALDLCLFLSKWCAMYWGPPLRWLPVYSWAESMQRFENLWKYASDFENGSLFSKK